MFVYKIKNKINGKCYIGQTTRSIEWRWKKHQQTSHCILLSNAIKKYGKSNFEVKCVVRCSSIEEMNACEINCIKLFNTLSPHGYNLDSGGKNKIPTAETKAKISKSIKGKNHPNFGKKHSKETKKRISEARMGIRPSKETRTKLSSLKKGRKITEKTREAIRKATLGIPKTEEHKRKISTARKSKPLLEEHKIAISNSLKKPIVCNETGKIYASIKEAAAALGGNPAGIWFVLTKPNRTFKGFTFSYFPQHE